MNSLFLTKTAYQSIFINKPNNIRILSFSDQKEQFKQLLFKNTNLRWWIYMLFCTVFSLAYTGRLKGIEVSVIHKRRKMQNIQSIPKHFSINDKLYIMNDLDVMISMDSSKYAFCFLDKYPVVSIWEATHPCIGFYGYRQPFNLAVQVNLPCRVPILFLG